MNNDMKSQFRLNKVFLNKIIIKRKNQMMEKNHLINQLNEINLFN